MNIQNAVALVTGANRGVGHEFVAQLIENGATKVYASARNLDSLSDVAALAPSRIVPIKIDVTNAEDIRKGQVAAPDVNLLINNAGSLNFGGALNLSNSDAAYDMAVNYDGSRNMTRAFAPVIEANGGGTVVNMLSLLSFVSAPGFSGYNASKAAAWSMAMSFRAYLRPKGIDVLNAFPGGIDTDMLAGVDAPKDSPRDVVADVLTAITENKEDVYPASAASVYDAWRENQKAVEAGFAAMV